jgi:tagatose 1,6-diphosphate aldolase
MDIPPVEFVQDIEFVDPGALIDEDLELRLMERTPADHVRGFAPTYRFAMLGRTSGVHMGGINLRVGPTEHLMLYRGHIGFGVEPAFRGNRLALRSCRLLAGLARHHSLVPVWLTCDVGNVASQKTLEALGAEFVEVRHMPSDYPYIAHYPPESRAKRRFRWMPGPDRGRGGDQGLKGTTTPRRPLPPTLGSAACHPQTED